MTDTKKIPLFPLGVVILPELTLPLHIFEDRYKLMISECIENDMPFGIVLFDGQNLHTVGCTARVIEVIKRHEDGRMDIVTRGEKRFLIQKVIDENPYMEAYVTFYDDEDVIAEDEVQTLIEKALNLILELSGPEQQMNTVYREARSSPLRLSFAIAALDGFTPKERQRFLEMTSTEERIKKGVRALTSIVERTRLTNEVQSIIGGNGSPPKRLLELIFREKQE